MPGEHPLDAARGFFSRWGWFLLIGAGVFFVAYLVIGRKNQGATTSSGTLAGQSTQNGANGQPVVEYVPTSGDTYSNTNIDYNSNNIANTGTDSGVGTINNPLPPQPVPPVSPGGTGISVSPGGSVGPIPPQPGPGGHPIPPQPGTVPPPPPANLPPSPSHGPIPPQPGPGSHPPRPPIGPIPPQPTYKTYTVKAGDTLAAIAAGVGTTWQNLYNINKATVDQQAAAHGSPVAGGPWNNIFPGETIQVPLGG